MYLCFVYQSSAERAIRAACPTSPMRYVGGLAGTPRARAIDVRGHAHNTNSAAHCWRMLRELEELLVDVGMSGTGRTLRCWRLLWQRWAGGSRAVELSLGDIRRARTGCT